LDSENEIIGSSSPEEDLRELLEASEKRKTTNIKRTAKSFSLIVGIPIAILVLWAALFLITYKPGPETSTQTEIPATLASQLSPKEPQNPNSDMIQDEKNHVVKTNILGLKETSGKLVDKEDIHFAMELLNFVRTSEPAEKKEK
jgi:hypothetical protein